MLIYSSKYACLVWGGVPLQVLSSLSSSPHTKQPPNLQRSRNQVSFVRGFASLLLVQVTSPTTNRRENGRGRCNDQTKETEALTSFPVF